MSREQFNRCWSPPCYRKAIFWDYCGWGWCAGHWWRNLKRYGGSKWFYFKTTKIFVRSLVFNETPAN